MASSKHDRAPESETTGHEWDGIRELNKPLPKWWLWTFYATIVWAIGYWLLMPAWPLVASYTTGWLGSRVPKRYILSFIYFGRAVVIALFVFLPLSVTTIYAFAVSLGLLWLSTVPPTNGMVAQIFGVRYMAMLSGFTFFSHQVGSFLGAWLGGKLYDTLGSYDLVWYLSIALGIVAGLINLPIDEREIRRPVATAG